MPLDGIFLSELTGELQKCVGCRADKIHQPSKDELVILLRSSSFTGKLLISARSGTSRLHITEGSFDNPAEPPSFCRLVRKHLSSAKITEIVQNGLDRTLFIKFMTYNEMGDTVYPFLAVELITGRANIVLCDEKGRILDALKRSDIESSARLIQPGASYSPPETQGKLNPFCAEADLLFGEVLSCTKPLSAAFCAVIEGISPLVSRELATKVCTDSDKQPCDLTADEKDRLKEVLLSLARRENFCPTILKDSQGAKDFSYIQIAQYGSGFENEALPSYSALLDEFYSQKDLAARLKFMAADLLRLVSNAKARTERKLSYRLADLEKCKDRENLRIFGELIKANLYAIEKGAKTARVQNYYDEEMSLIDIPLDESLSPSANAAKYFKEYKKSYTAEQTLSALTKKDSEEIDYLDSVLDCLSRAKTAADVNEIREELAEAGYIKRKGPARRRQAAPCFKEYLSPSGMKILVGRNNRENDLLTLKTACKQDIWFHTKNIPGSHVILFTEGRSPGEEDFFFAAGLAAGHSAAKESDNVPVDFCEVKYVKKPSGAKPGMVIYTTNRTVYVKPDKG